MIESAFPILEVPDMEAALAFYRDALGGVVSYRFPTEGEPVYVVARRWAPRRSGIGLAETAPPAGQRASSWFYVDDVDRVTAAARRRRGHPIVEEPADQQWGERTSLMKDPFGTRLHLGAAISPPPDEE